jgi:uncharacterized protein (TIGR03435 family)
MEELTNFLTLVLSLGLKIPRPVVDHTGLDGLYAFDLNFRNPLFPSGDPDLFTALQQQLGLKLEERKESFKVLVVDRFEMPPN